MPEKHNRENPQAPLNLKTQVNFEARTTVSGMVLVRQEPPSVAWLVMYITALHALRLNTRHLEAGVFFLIQYNLKTWHIFYLTHFNQYFKRFVIFLLHFRYDNHTLF